MFSYSAAVSSSTIAGLAYSEEGNTLAVTFKSGLSYIYTGVPKATAVGLLGADSVGEFHNTEVKGCYPYLKVGLQDQTPPMRTNALPTEENMTKTLLVGTARRGGRSKL